MKYTVAASADVSADASIGDGSSIWHLAQVREGAVLGENCVVGRGAYVGTGVQIGNNVKIQNYALVYEPAHVEDGAFIGPAAVLTNDHFPRSVNPDGSLKSGHDWEPVGVTVREGASIGARAVCVAPVTIGRWAMVAAGATVVRDVPTSPSSWGSQLAESAGSAAQASRWSSQRDDQDLWVCPTTGAEYRQAGRRPTRGVLTWG